MGNTKKISADLIQMVEAAASNLSTVNKEQTEAYIESKWDDWYVKGLSDFIRVENLSPNYDAQFLTNGLIEQAMELVDNYINQLGVEGLSKQIFQPEGSVPLVVYVVEPTHGSTKKCHALRPSGQAAMDGGLGRGSWTLRTRHS